MTLISIRGDARRLPLPDDTVDLVVTSPPYYALRSYRDGGKQYDGQIGQEPTPQGYVDSLLDVTRECVRVLKPSGSLWINLGDKYVADNRGSGTDAKRGPAKHAPRGPAGYPTGGWPHKSLMGLPWRYALRCMDELGLTLRAEIIWAKPNPMPESTTDRVKRAHEQWFHLTLGARYYSATDEIREPHRYPDDARHLRGGRRSINPDGSSGGGNTSSGNPLGAVPGSVWTVPSEPLDLPEHLGVEHYAAFPTFLPKQIITAWCPREVCQACGEGRRPVAERTPMRWTPSTGNGTRRAASQSVRPTSGTMLAPPETRIVGSACICPDTSAPSLPGVVIDPFGGTGTTAQVAHALGRVGVSVDMSGDYARVAADPEVAARRWRKVHDLPTPPRQTDGQGDLLAGML